MHRLLSVSESEVTRYVKLINCETDKEEHCFDDSDVRDDYQEDFGFMTIGNVYECKILLFDCIIVSTESPRQNCMDCRIVNDNLSIGNLNVIQVENNRNIYYVAKKDILCGEKKNNLLLSFSRKDLVQVNDTIAPRYLR